MSLDVSQDTLVTSDDKIDNKCKKSGGALMEMSSKEDDVQPSTSGGMEVGGFSEAGPSTWSSEVPYEAQQSVGDNGIKSLSSIFPSASRETVRNSLLTYKNIELAAEALSESSVKKEVKDEDVHQILNSKTVYETIYVLRETES